MLSDTPYSPLKPAFHLHIFILVSTMISKFLRKVLNFSSPHYLALQTLKKKLKQEVEGVIFSLAWPQIKMRKHGKSCFIPSHGKQIKVKSYLDILSDILQRPYMTMLLFLAVFFTLEREVTRLEYTWTGKGNIALHWHSTICDMLTCPYSKLQ